MLFFSITPLKMAEYFEEDDKDIEILYDSTTFTAAASAVKKEEVKESKDVKKEEEEDPEQTQQKLMGSMNLPTQFAYGNGRYQDVKLRENCSMFCDLCQVQMRTVQAYQAHVIGKRHCKNLIATGL